MHCPLARTLDGRGVWTAPAGPNRYTSVVSSAGWSQRSAGVGHAKRPATLSQVEAVARRSLDEGAGQPAGRLDVGVHGDDPLAGGRPQPLVERPRLAHPARGERRAGEHRGAQPACELRRCRRWTRRPRPGPPVTVGSPRSASRSGRSAPPRPGPGSRRRWSSWERLLRQPPGAAAAGRPSPAGSPPAPARPNRMASPHHPTADRGRRGRPLTSRPGATRSATMRPLIVTSGRPPPGWLEPPTRYRPRRGPRLAGRRNAARRPFDEVP